MQQMGWVNFKNGSNLPIIVVSIDNGTEDQHHTTIGCVVNLISLSPPEFLYNNKSLGCKNTFQAFVDASIYCTSNATVASCEPNCYTNCFKEACPWAISFVNDKSNISYCPLV
ncbi:hypothetical protein FEM48_Zijuj08G0177400 [Ziziphus jujuba var. spinosa]|uniref:Uncharacterized protein n=1 Tax=Ziziphus jujuba var. spinosa TaxID=714518 RepID=A0A978V0H4_ZIZJJ|nr:hypothetical protein FEM48_Zijuj08G0177400 [Ziziphus jujuba var. spinosa]